MASTIDFKKDFEYWEDVTNVARSKSRRDRDYRDGKQWTEEEQSTLEARGQAPIVINKIGPKIDFMIGVERTSRQDPKAWPRNPNDEEAANAITDSLRYVADNVDFDATASECFEDSLVEGIEAGIVEWQDEEIKVTRIPFDRVYYDPHSIKRDFSDATYKGLFVWMYKDDAMRVFDKKSDEIELAFTDASQDAGIEDKPSNWIDTKKERLKVCQHYYQKDGEWRCVYFSGELILVDDQESPYLDENGKPLCPIELRHAYIDRDGQRYGWTRQFIDIQDEINHRRSKALYLLSTRQVIMERGAVDDIDDTREELTKGDGVVEVNPGLRFEIDSSNDLASGQAELLAEAKAEIEMIANRSQVAAEASGRSRLMADSKDLLEVGPLFDTHKSFKRAIYRQIWLRIKQFWDEEKWIRVTDNEGSMKFVGLNKQVTAGDELKAVAEQGDQQAQAILQQMLATQDPRLNTVIGVENNVAELDADVKLGEVMDAANVQQEQFEMLVQLAQSRPEVPFKMLVEMSQLRNKKELTDMLEGDPQQQAANQQMQMQQVQMQMARMQAEIDKMSAEAQNKQADTRLKIANTEKTEQQAIQTAVETQVLATQPADSVSVNT